MTEPEVPEAVKPVPVQLVAFVEDQVSVEDWFAVIEVGLAESETVGAGVVPPPEVFTSPQLESVCEHAPTSADCAGRYDCVTP